ncbi:MAG: preprotein translocase subunit YajC [Deltaproteobacteria bacterium]
MKNDIITILMMIAIFALFYATVVMPQRKRERKILDMQSMIKVGDEIVTFAGILGRIINISNDTITLETGPEKTKISIYKWAVKETINKNK